MPEILKPNLLNVRLTRLNQQTSHLTNYVNLCLNVLIS